ncbi:MAG TPA: hypothetical protein VHX20_04155 [Terracidiphilus sp.]|jgi:hypothetical protein|nr:hypothetical protein [Terracidiphilus sp.]
MIAWILGLVTLILLLFVFWRNASNAFRARSEEPKFLFLESLGISVSRGLPCASNHSIEEKQQ